MNGGGNCVVVEKSFAVYRIFHYTLQMEFKNKNPLKRTTTELFRGFGFPSSAKNH